jgi:hypothetical protein
MFSTWPTNIFFIATATMVSYFLIERPFLRIKEHGGRKRAAGAGKPLVGQRVAGNVIATSDLLCVQAGAKG